MRRSTRKQSLGSSSKRMVSHYTFLVLPWTTKLSFQFQKDDNGREFVSMTHDEATKNHPGGIEDTNSTEKEARMYITSKDPLFDGLNCLKIYLQKLNPKSEAREV